jgi:hypothetical protein
MELVNESVNIIETQFPYVGNGLDLDRTLFVLLIREMYAQLFAAALEGIPSRQATRKVDVAG